MHLNNIIFIPISKAYICLQYQILFIIFTFFQIEKIRLGKKLHLNNKTSNPRTP